MRAIWARVIIVGVFLAVFGIKYIAVTFFGPPDEVLVKEALDRAIVASREGRPGGVLENISSQLKLNSDMPSSGQIANFIKNNHPDVQVEKTDAIVNGDTARITSPIRVKVSFLGTNIDQRVDSVSMVFKREEAHEWLVIPVKAWRLDQVFLPETLTPSGNGY